MAINKPIRCSICGFYLTTAEQFAGYRCSDPSHWQTVGLLTTRDYYPMAKLTAQATSEHKLRPDNRDPCG